MVGQKEKQHLPHNIQLDKVLIKEIRMKNALFTLALCTGIFAGAADLNWSGRAPWEKNENGEFTIDYQNKGWPRLTSKQEAKAGKFYRVTFDCKRDGANVPSVYLRANNGNGSKEFGIACCTFNNWSTQCGYFPAEKEGALTVIWGFNPKAEAKLAVRNGKFEEVSPEMMKQNLVLNGNFEYETVKGTAFWKDINWKERSFPGQVVPGQDFMNGEKSLELPFGSGIKSISVPMEKGRKYQFTFWAKGTKDAVIGTSLSLWSIRGHKGKHFHTSRKFKLETTWKQYQFEITVPTDEEKYPDLKVGTGEIAIRVKGDDGKYYLDDISYCEKE